MKKKKIYIAGKVSGLPSAETSMKFGTHEKKLLTEGHTPIVPLNLCEPGEDWYAAMKKCLREMLLCDEVHMLYDWQSSRGATLEHLVAANLGIKIVYV